MYIQPLLIKLNMAPKPNDRTKIARDTPPENKCTKDKLNNNKVKMSFPMTEPRQRELNKNESDSIQPFTSKSDAEIWKMFKNGHEGAFKYIYDTYFYELFHYGYRLAEDKEMVKDCIQDLFIELRKSSGLAKVQSIKYYLMKALKWKIRRYTSRSRKLILGEEWKRQDEFYIVDSRELTYLVEESDQEAQRLLKKGINNLPARQREALYYFYYENLSYKEVASMMGLSSIKSARNTIYKALTSIRKFWQ